jgi:HEAT repeat protein
MMPAEDNYKMAHRRVEDQISALDGLREEASSATAEAALRTALADRVGLVTAKAARMAAELGMRSLIPDLLRAFDRLLEKPLERDPQCWGKNAIAEALTQMDYRESTPYVRGARHVQMEPVYGGQEDTAPQLRSICVLALAGCTDLRREGILRILVDLLADRANVVRTEAARAIAQMGGDEAELLLRLKARMGDEEPQVAGQVFDCVLGLEGEGGVEFVAQFLAGANPQTREEAALSLGSSRLPAAVARLQTEWEQNRDQDLRLAVLRALSASRLEPALDFLLGIVRNGRRQDRNYALEALKLHQGTEIWLQVEEAIRAQASDGG